MPDWKRYLRENLSLPMMKGHRDKRAIDEMADHLEDLYQDAIARGRTEEDARALVLARLGDPQGAADELTRAEPHHVSAQVDRWFERQEDDLKTKGSYWATLSDGLKDLRLGLRGLARRPLFTGVAILVLALGIGGTSAIFTLVNAIVLSPLPFDDADRLVAVQHSAPNWGMADAGQCAAWHFTYEDEARVFDALGMFLAGETVSITGNGDPEAVPALEVTNGVFRALRLTPALGRIFTPEDDDPDAPPTVMLGYGYWQSRYVGSPDVIGQTIQVDGATREIIGVAPREVESLGPSSSMIVPLRFRRAYLFVGNNGYGAVGRLKEGISLEVAAADLNRVLPMAWEKFPGGPVASSSDIGQITAEIYPFKEDLVGPVAGFLWILQAGVGIVLLIACANVANLYLVRAEGKDGEMAVRAAMGASGRRIRWEYLKESLLLGLVGGAAGLIVAQAGLRSLLILAPVDLPRIEEVTLDARVLLFTLVISLVAGLLFGFIPALRHARRNLVDVLKQGGRSGTRDRKGFRAQNLLAVGQVALALVLLVASGLMLRSFQTLRSMDPGFQDPGDVLTVRLYIPGREVPGPAQVASTYESIVHSIEEIPGVVSVGLATAIPMDGSMNFNPLYVQGQEPDRTGPRAPIRHKWIGEGYRETLEIPLLAGRSFTWDDIHNRAPLAMLSESLAREIFGSPEAAIGHFLAARPDPPAWKEIVGVVKDVREDGMDQDPPLLVYWPQVTLGFWEGDAPDDVLSWRRSGIAVRSDRLGTPGFRRELAEAIWAVNPNLPLLQVQTLPDLMAASIARTAFIMILLGIAGAVALILGLVGVYGVISYAVSQRSRELGIRIALGAEQGRVVAMVVGQGAILAGTGVALGLALAFGLIRLMSGVLFGVSPMDPATYAVAAGGLLTVALLAGYVPARRAARVDPIGALRAQ
jgi:putative ABC transport system permease protein